MIRAYVRLNPGDCYTDIKRGLGLANGEVAYHLGVLEREGLVRSRTKGARREYYPPDVAIPEDGGGLHDVQIRLVQHVEAVPGMTVRDLAGVLAISNQLALYHVRRLVADRVLRVERRGMRFHVYAAGTDAGSRPRKEDT